MMGEGFNLDVNSLTLFFRFIRRYKIADDDKETRIRLLRELVRRKKATYIPHPTEFLAGKRIVRFK